MRSPAGFGRAGVVPDLRDSQDAIARYEPMGVHDLLAVVVLVGVIYA